MRVPRQVFTLKTPLETRELRPKRKRIAPKIYSLLDSFWRVPNERRDPGIAKLGVFSSEKGVRRATDSSLEVEGWVWEVGKCGAFDEEVRIVTSAAFEHSTHGFLDGLADRHARRRRGDMFVLWVNDGFLC